MSPLDVGLYAPLKKALSKSVAALAVLKHATMAKWLGEALDQVFLPETIINAFHATGIWDKTLNRPNPSKTCSQYATAFAPLPPTLLKLNESARMQKAIELARLDRRNRFELERKKLYGPKVVVGGPRFAKNVLAGNLSQTLILGEIRAMQAELQDEMITIAENKKKADLERKALSLKKSDKIKAICRDEVSGKTEQILLLRKELAASKNRT